jgi:hypothetical protein
LKSAGKTRLEQAISCPLEKIKQELETTDLNKEPIQDAESRRNLW